MKWGPFIASLIGFFGILLGAFGAHYLKGVLPEESFKVFQTGSLYHLVHTPLLFLLAKENFTSPLGNPFYHFLGGIFLFSGSLYLLALTQTKILGMITPFGGLLLLSGWATLGFCKKGIEEHLSRKF